MTKTCSVCRNDKPLDEFGEHPTCRLGRRPDCRSCHRALENARRKMHRRSVTPEYKREHNLRHKYGITGEEYAARFAEQDGRCSICRKRGELTGNKRLNVDHCHLTRRNRDLLCRDCNVGLGVFADDPDLLEAACAYLRRHQVEERQIEAEETS